MNSGFTPKQGRDFDRFLMKQADAYWEPPRHVCQACEEVEIESSDWEAPWMCEQCIADRADDEPTDAEMNPGSSCTAETMARDMADARRLK